MGILFSITFLAYSDIKITKSAFSMLFKKSFSNNQLRNLIYPNGYFFLCSISNGIILRNIVTILHPTGTLVFTSPPGQKRTSAFIFFKNIGNINFSHIVLKKGLQVDQFVFIFLIFGWLGIYCDSSAKI